MGIEQDRGALPRGEGGFDTIMPKSLATAAVDRFLHHAHMVLTEGGSLRVAEAIVGKGVKPLV